MQLEALFQQRQELRPYEERVFLDLKLNIGLTRPILFLVNREQTLDAGYFSLNTLDDLGYSLHIVTCENYVLFYLIDVKVPNYNRQRNGLILSTRAKWSTADAEGVNTRYSFDDFVVVTNKRNTYTVMARNTSSIPKT